MDKKKYDGPVMLIVLDGWGYRADEKNNAIAEANTPYFDLLWQKYPHTLLKASGLAVGVPEGQMGNSEVGHTTIGAGRPIDSDLVRISKAISAGELGKNPSIIKLFEHVNKNDSTLHAMGLIGSGGVHAYSEHLFAFMRAAKDAGVKKLAIHVFTDGRDTPPQSACGFIKELEEEIKKDSIGKIASVSGRFYAMDRDNNWDREKKAEDAIFEGKGDVCNIDPSDYVSELYKQGKMDEHLVPFICVGEDKKPTIVEKNDGIFFFNFRADRTRMLSQKIIERTKDKNVCFVTMTEYNPEFKCLVAFPPLTIETTLAAEIAKAGMTQCHIAETEKFPHATYFLNGRVEKPHAGEIHELVPSRKDVPTHDLAPEMMAEAIADKAIEFIEENVDFIFINFANADMVGHTANVPAIITAVEVVDTQLGRVISSLQAKGGIAFITADHGNAEVNIDPETGEKHTSHTTNPVPAIITEKGYEMRDGGGLSDVAPTILVLMDLPKPSTMTGNSLL